MAWPLSQILRLGLVPLSGNCTIAGEKTFSGTTRIQATLAGPRRNVLTSAAPAVADSGAYITTSGNLTVLTSAVGQHFLVELGGDHNILFNSTTCDVSTEGWGTGDILHVFVKSATVCKVWREVAAADLGAFA